MKFKILLTFTLCLILNIYANHSHADAYMYKWKSADGELHYTEYTPAKGIEYERIRVTLTRSTQSSDKKKIKPDDKETDLVKDDSYKSWQKENCAMAKKNLDILENAIRIAQDDGEGGTRLMTDEEKQASIEKMKQQRDKYCKEQP